MKFHHLGIACANIDETLAYIQDQYEVLKISDMVYDSKQNAYLQMVELADGLRLELVAGEVIASYIKKKNYLYHMCYATENIEQVILKMQMSGDFLVKEPREAILFNGQRVAFLMTPLGLIELLEESKHGKKEL